MRVLFLFGTLGPQENKTIQEEVDLEQSIHCDILQFDFVDHYTNITLDSLHALKFALGWKWKTKPEYLIISDDDSYINLKEVYQFLKSESMITKVQCQI